MDDRDQANSSSEIKSRIEEARAKSKPDRQEASAKGVGFKIGLDLFAGVLFGVGSGIYLDRWLGTAPWLLLVMIVLGFGAGIRNVIRTAELENKKYRDRQGPGPES